MSLQAQEASAKQEGEIRGLFFGFTRLVWALFGPLALCKVVVDVVSQRGRALLAKPRVAREYDVQIEKLARFEVALQGLREQHIGLQKLLDEQKELYQALLAKLYNQGGTSKFSDKLLERPESCSPSQSFSKSSALECHTGSPQFVSGSGSILEE